MSLTKLFISIVVGALLCVALFMGAQYLQQLPSTSSNTSHPVPVITATAIQENIPVQIRSIGTVVSPHNIEVRSQVDGEIIELLVTDGQRVTQGQALARIDDRSINAILRQQRAELANRQAQLNVALLDLNRYQRLHTQNAISEQQLDQQNALVTQLRQAILTQQAVINEQEIKLSYTQINAPISGVMSLINIHRGNYVRTGDAQSLFSIAQVNPINVDIALPQSILPQLLPAAHANNLPSILVFAYSNDEKTLLAEGHLAHLNNQVSATTGTIRARARFDNTDQNLWPGQTIIAVIQISQIENAIVIPKTALQHGNQYTYVWRITDGQAESIHVQVVHTTTELIAVTGIQAGDIVVTDGATRLTNGAQVQQLQSNNSMLMNDRDVLETSP